MTVRCINKSTLRDICSMYDTSVSSDPHRHRVEVYPETRRVACVVCLGSRFRARYMGEVFRDLTFRGQRYKSYFRLVSMCNKCKKSVVRDSICITQGAGSTGKEQATKIPDFGEFVIPFKDLIEKI